MGFKRLVIKTIVEATRLVRGQENLIQIRFKKLGVGKMLNLHIDPEKGEISCSIDLVGEDVPLKVEVKKYSIEKKDKKTSLHIGEISISKKWMEILARNYLKQRRGIVPIPKSKEDFISLLK